MTYLIAIDPGKATGIAWGKWPMDPTEPFEFQGHRVVTRGLAGLLKFFYSEQPLHKFDTLICESFTLDGRTVKPDLTPLKIEGALQALCWDKDINFILQKNSLKRHATDETLKANDLWQTGKPFDWDDARDVNDATRHLLAYLKIQNHVPSMKKFWPDNE